MVETPQRTGQDFAKMRAPLDHLADSNIIGIVMVKADGLIVRANDEFLRIVGYSREDLEAGRLDWLKMTPMEWSFATREARKQMEDTGKAAPFEKEFFRKDGGRVPVLTGIVGPPSPGALALCFVLDLTERKQSEKDLDRLMIERFAMLDSVADGVFGLDMEGRCTFINPAALRMLGYEGDECLGRNMHDLIHYKTPEGEPLSREACPVTKAVRNCVAMRADHDVLWRKDGGSFDVEYSSCPIVVNGRAEGSVLSFKDISERKKAEANLRASEERFRGAFEHAAAGMSIANFEGRYLEVNAAFCRMSGYDEKELLARNYQALTHPDDVVGSIDILEKLRRKEIPGFVMEKRHLRKDGSTLWVRCSVAPLCDAGGNLDRFVTILEDITERVHLPQHTDPLTERVAHDLNGLLSVILGQSAILVKRLGAEDARSENVAEIQKAAQRAAAMIANLRGVSDEAESHVRVVSANEVVRGMESLLRSTLGSAVELFMRLDPEAGNIRVDPERMEEVILSLAIQAHDTMPQGGRLVIESERWNPESGVELPAALEPGAYVLLTFWDNGCGIDEETRVRLLDAGVAKESAAVGLDAVAGIVAKCGGAISATSERDEGTTFRIYLPLAPASGKMLGKLLVVDDDPQARNVLTSLFELEGYTVSAAANGREAEKVCRKSPPDLVITDIIMPDQDGIETIHKLKGSWPSLPVIAISGVLGSGFLEMAKKLGADVVLHKPIDPERILGEVRRLVAK